MGDVLVVAEYEENRIHPITFELLGKANELSKKLNGKVRAVILGRGVRDIANELVYYGADTVHVYDNESLRFFNVLLYKENIVSLIKKVSPDLVLIGATNKGRSLAPRIAASLKTGLTADCIDIFVEKGKIIQVRPAFTGNIIAHIYTKTRPVLTTIRYRVMKPLKKDEKRKGEIIVEDLKFSNNKDLKVLGKIRDKEVRISDADIIVSFGRGVKRRDDIKMIKELADLLGGVVGASRPVVDEGWISKDHQIGFSGNTVRPRLYMAFGISGSPQHLAGMKDSEIVIAVNIDSSAPIFRYSDYCIVADLYHVIPNLIRRLKKIGGSNG